MPANLTPEYKAAEEQFRSARSHQEKLEALELMLATIPKHKGTEKMQADLKRKLSKMRKSEGKKGGKRTFSYHVEKQGAAQAILIGPPNSGKTTLINSVTNADLNVGNYPFTTRIMQPAMMPYQNIQIQLVDTPAIHPDYYERWVFGLIRYADIALLVVDLGSSDVLGNIDNLLGILEEGRIFLVKDFPTRKLPPGVCHKKTILIGNKMDKKDAEDNLEIIREFYQDQFRILPVSCKTGWGLDTLKEKIFKNLGIIRVYTKSPGQDPDLKKPFILKQGQTVEDLAHQIHKDLAKQMKFARIWGEGYYDGQPVEQSHPLKDEDIIEIHT